LEKLKEIQGEGKLEALEREKFDTVRAILINSRELFIDIGAAPANYRMRPHLLGLAAAGV
jgi:hypothetical protein